jgi:hypothetical protein
VKGHKFEFPIMVHRPHYVVGYSAVMNQKSNSGMFLKRVWAGPGHMQRKLTRAMNIDRVMRNVAFGHKPQQ